MTPQEQYAHIRRACAVLFEPNSVVELRILGSRKGTVSGYFNDMDKLAKAAITWSGKAEGIYVTLNPVNPILLARSNNQAIEFAKHTTSDTDIVKRRWLPIDFDPVRPSGISSTEDEHEYAIKRSMDCADWLDGRGWPQPVLADSGNGAHLLYRIDLPNDDVATKTVKSILEAISLKFNEPDRLSVDQTTFNPSRIWKLYGTLAAKGASMPDRPHRYAMIGAN